MSDSNPIKITNCTEIVQNIQHHLQKLKAETCVREKFINSSKELLLMLEQVCIFLQTNPLSVTKPNSPKIFIEITDKTYHEGVSQLFHEYMFAMMYFEKNRQKLIAEQEIYNLLPLYLQKGGCPQFSESPTTEILEVNKQFLPIDKILEKLSYEKMSNGEKGEMFTIVCGKSLKGKYLKSYLESGYACYYNDPQEKESPLQELFLGLVFRFYANTTFSFYTPLERILYFCSEMPENLYWHLYKKSGLLFDFHTGCIQSKMIFIDPNHYINSIMPVLPYIVSATSGIFIENKNLFLINNVQNDEFIPNIAIIDDSNSVKSFS